MKFDYNYSNIINEIDTAFSGICDGETSDSLKEKNAVELLDIYSDSMKKMLNEYIELKTEMFRKLLSPADSE